MKIFLILTAFICLSLVRLNAQVITTDSNGVEHIEVYPEYPGGEDALHNFLDNNMKYPSEARKKNITGKVILSFIVDKLGNVTNVAVLKGIGGGCDEEAVRVVKLMPKWKPATQDGLPVNVKYTFPINFALK